MTLLPSGDNLAAKLPPAGIVESAALAVTGNDPPVLPATYVKPALSMAMALAASSVEPPSSVEKITLPEESRLAISASIQGRRTGWVPTTPLGPTEKCWQSPPPACVCAAPGD